MAKMAHIYVIEDDTALRDELERLLELQGFTTAHCEDFSCAAARALQANADCVVLDLKLPGADGHQVCRDIRAKSAVPIIMLTSSENEFDEVMALGLGADDYVTKPYRPATLIARIQGVLRRSSASALPVLEHDGLQLDEASGTVIFGSKRAELTRNELRILQLLMRNAGQVVSRQQLMVHLWESDSFIDDNTLTVNINRLRRVLSDLGVGEEFIKTRRGIGYVI
ncbi:response regulator transcription factor [Adlercreutzia sp. ZJ154]|uniref:response regulator transcription factor n=1 Tax=Adlercreutzia sp. ZJ154 TaxID=2709790 RepID=UPI001F1552D7|nr:response regulator transcription factor [Adlercreutzia sp. ZJ154]